MQIDTEHLHHWFRAVRESKDPMRTMDAFWRGQIKSKEWLIEQLSLQIHHVKSYPTVEIHGGWVGVLASMLFQSDLGISFIKSIDIDPGCEEISVTMNQIEFEEERFEAVTDNMCAVSACSDIIINTSFEHLTEEQYNLWFSKLPGNRLIILQSNNYDIPEHVRIAKDLEEFKSQAKIENIFYCGELELPLYKRFMIIGKKDV